MGCICDLSIWSRPSWVILNLSKMAKPSWGNHWLPPGSQMITGNVVEAYHMIPLNHLQCPSTVIQLDNNSFAINTMLWFGSGPSAGCTVQCRMLPQTFCISKALGPYPAGWMITSSSYFGLVLSWNTARGAGYGIGTSCQEVNIRKAKWFGSEVGGSRMVHSKNWRIVPFHVGTYLGF